MLMSKDYEFICIRIISLYYLVVILENKPLERLLHQKSNCYNHNEYETGEKGQNLKIHNSYFKIDIINKFILG